MLKLIQWIIRLFKKPTPPQIKEIVRDYKAPDKPPEVGYTTGSHEYYFYHYYQAEIGPGIIHHKRVAYALDQALRGRKRYENVERYTGVPWYLVAAIHGNESSFNWSCNLVNGQPLSQRTTIKPVGMGPWSTWEDAAKDALQSRANQVNTWTLENTLAFAEKYNGLGYLRRNAMSPYIWACTNLYVKGKFSSDGVFDQSLVSEQVGVAALIKALERNGYIKLTYSKLGLISNAL